MQNVSKCILLSLFFLYFSLSGIELRVKANEIDPLDARQIQFGWINFISI